MAIFLIGEGECEFSQKQFAFVESPTQEAARAKYGLRYGIGFDLFLNEVYSKYWFTDGEEIRLKKQGGPTTAENFEQRVHAYFAEHPEYADLYLQYHFGDVEYPEVAPFSDDMLLHFWLHSDWSVLTIYTMDEIDIL